MPRADTRKAFDAGLSDIPPGGQPRQPTFAEKLAEWDEVSESVAKKRRRQQFATNRMVEGTKAAEEAA